MNELTRKQFFLSKKRYIFIGFLFACLAMIPYLILGTGSIVTYHDQLDGELFSYILTAKYLFTDLSVYPEIMNGLPSTGAVPPAPLFVIFYVIFKPFTAFMISQWIINIVGFLGMFLLLSKLTKENGISFIIAVIFMLMPFYPVYGFCIPGQPLLWYAVCCLCDIEKAYGLWNKEKLASKLLFMALIILYGLGSSLVLVGFACLLVLLVWTVSVWFKLVRSRHNRIHNTEDTTEKSALLTAPAAAMLILGITYLGTNLSLIKQVLFPATKYISHKAEIVLSPQGFKDSFINTVTNGVSYAQSHHAVILVVTVFVLFVIGVKWVGEKFNNTSNSDSVQNSCSVLKSDSEQTRKHDQSRHRTHILLLSAFIVLVGLYYAFYHGRFITELRNSSDGLLKEFNLDRIAWLLPVTWCVLAGYVLTYILHEYKSLHILLRKGIILAVLGIWGLTILWNSGLKPNISKLVKGGNYYALDWQSFFAEDIFAQIDAEISATGKAKDDYRVISVGIYPAAAAYNGFYCLDGYSNNYPLDYKHEFREIMEGELAKSDYVRDFFDNWGNRCYITTAEQANYYTFEKKWNSVIYDLDLNIDKLKEMNCEYIFSAAYIMNAEELGLKLMRETPFETEGSWYHIWVYEID